MFKRPERDGFEHMLRLNENCEFIEEYSFGDSMTRVLLKDRLQQGVFFIDGAMGTQIIEAGAPAGCCNEFLCIETPQIIETVHRKYIDAGVDAVITNTFGANELVLKRHGHEKEAYAVNLAAAKLARDVAGAEKYVLGGFGPCGDFLQPLGMFKEDDLKAAFAEQAKGLARRRCRWIYYRDHDRIG